MISVSAYEKMHNFQGYFFQDFPGPGIFKKKIQDFPGGVVTLNI